MRGDRIFNNANSVIATQAATPVHAPAVDDTILVAVDFDGGSLWFGRNRSWFTGTPAPGSTTGRNCSFAAGPALYPVLTVPGTVKTVRLAVAAGDLLPSACGIRGVGLANVHPAQARRQT